MPRLTIIAALVFLSPLAYAQSATLQLLPDRIAVGADVSGFVRGDNPNARRNLFILSADGNSGASDRLMELTLESNGRVSFTSPLPAIITPGDYFVTLVQDDPVRIVAQAELEVTPPPTIEFDRSAAYGGTEVGVTFSNLVPGVIDFYLDDVPVIGSRAVSDTEFSTTVRVPRGEAGSIDAALVNRVGERVAGIGANSFSREGEEIPEPQVRSLTWPEQFSVGDIIEITGEIAAPVGTRVTDFNWTTVWITREGGQFPVNTRPIQFTFSGPQAPLGGEPVAFTTNVALPSMASGFPYVDKSQADQLGFVYTNPTTGGLSGLIVHPDAARGLDDELGITITGRLVQFDRFDDSENPDLSDNPPLVDAIWNVAARTELIEPGTQVERREGSKGEATTRPVNVLATELHGNNQLVNDNPNIQLLTPAGCPKTLASGVTDINGEFKFAFSPYQTESLNLIQPRKLPVAGGTEEYIGGESFADEFRIRLSALLQGYGIPLITDQGDVAVGGIVYEFKRDPNDGSYAFRTNYDERDAMGEPLPAEYNRIFDPRTTLFSVMGEVNTSDPNEFPSDIYMQGISSSDPTTERPQRFSKIIAFPSQRGTDLDNRAVGLVLKWSDQLNGPLEEDILVTLGEPPVPVGIMTPDSDDRCQVEQAYRIGLTGLATWDLKGKQSEIVPGRIETVTPEGISLFKNFEILIEQGPTWWDDPDQWENVSISWNADSIRIRADEKARKENSAPADNVPKNVGSLDNTNAEVAYAAQSIVGGHVGELTRYAVSDQVIANQPAGKQAVFKTHFTGGGEGGVQVLPMEWVGEEHQKNEMFEDDDCPPGTSGPATVICLKNRFAAGNENEVTGSDGPVTILDTGKIPLFRYAWGVPPIAALTLGADIWFRATLTYFMFVDVSPAKIDIDGLVEPEVTGGLDVFVDLSVLGGIVSASVTATPALGIAMPIVMTNTLLNEDATEPCFNFVMDIILTVDLGPCPACFGLKFRERIIEYAKEAGCVVSGLNNKGLVQQSLPAGKLALATDGFGTTTALYAAPAGITALDLQSGVPGNLQSLQSGPGAMRPAAAFFDAGRGLAVWAQSSLTEEEFNALQDQESDDPCHDDTTSSYQDTLDNVDTCTAPGPNRLPGTEFQHMVYSILDNGVWGPTQHLTLPTTGEGGVELAACLAGDPGCPAGGEILAVWEIDTAMDVSEHQFKLRYARFDGASQTWSAISTVDPTSTAKDVQGEPLYIAGDPVAGSSAEPVITWVRNADTSRRNLSLQSNELWYEFINEAAGPQLGVDLPTGLGLDSPSADDFTDRSFAVAFTGSTDNTFFGNRRALFIARAENCQAGICTWTASASRDRFGRRMFIENPSMHIDDQDRVTVFGRQLGIDGEFTGLETIGVVSGAGDLFRYRTSLAQLNEGSISQISNDGAVNWQTESAFDAATGNFVVLNSKGLGVEQLVGTAAGKSGADSVVARPVAGVMTKGLTGSTGVFINLQQQGPDGVVMGAFPASTILTPGSGSEVEVFIDNIGDGFGTDVELAAFWDGPYGAGIPAGSRMISPDDGPTSILLAVDVPETFKADEKHLLYVTLNPDMTVSETTLDNNTVTVAFGKMPIPMDLIPSVDAAGTVAFLDWMEPEDNRVSGYRVYRREKGSDTIFSVGFTPVNGFADLNVLPNTTYDYRVASVSENMMESEPSAWIRVEVSEIRRDVVFSNSFE